jgi:hypothetical protein
MASRSFLLDNLKMSFVLAWSSRLRLAFCVVLDLLFLLAFLFSFAAISLEVWEHVESLFNIAQDGLAAVSSLDLASSALGSIVRQPEFAFHLQEAMKWIFVQMAVAYLIFVLFQSASWFICQAIVNRKVRYFPYLARFASVSALWLGLFYIASCLWVRLSVQIRFSVFPAVSQSLVSALFLVISIVIAYFAMISFGLVSNVSSRVFFKSIFHSAFRSMRMLTVFCLIVIVAIIFAIAYFVLVQSGQLFLFFLFTILIVLPAVCIARILVILAVAKKN